MIEIRDLLSGLHELAANYCGALLFRCKFHIRTHVQRAKSGYKFGYISWGNIFCGMKGARDTEFVVMFVRARTYK